MSRYRAGICKLNDEDFISIEENVKPTVYSQIKRLDNSSEWVVNYGFDFMSCGWFIQFERIEEEDEVGERTIDVDYLFDKLNGKEFAFILKRFFENNQLAMFHAESAEMDVVI